MALRFMCSCGDHLTAAQMTYKWDLFNDCAVDAGGYNGTSGFGSSSGVYSRVRAVKRVAPNPANEIVFGFRALPPAGYFPVGGSPTIVLSAIHYAGSGSYSLTTKQLSFHIRADGGLEVRRGSHTGTVIGTTSAAVFSNNTWAFVEIHALIASGTGGSVTVVVNNTTVLSITGANTLGMGAPTVDGIEIVPGWIMDDVYICDRTAVSGNPYVYFLGKGFHVVANRMSANSSVEWTPPSGQTNEEAIDDTTPDGSVNSASLAGKTDLFTPTALSASVARIIAVQGNVIGSKPSSAYSPTVADVCQIDGTNYVDTAQALTGSLTDHRFLRATNPADGSEWTRAVYNASLRGYRRTA